MASLPIGLSYPSTSKNSMSWHEPNKHDYQSTSDGFNESSSTTEVKYVLLNYVWKIRNFKSFCSMKTGEYVGSRPFQTTLDSKGMVIIWQLKVYPNGLDEQSRCKVVAMLQCFSCSSPEAAKVEFSFHTHKADHSICRSSRVMRWVALKPNTHEFCVIGHQNEILQDQVDNTLIISCSGKVVDIFVTLSNPTTERKFRTVVPFKYTWKINKYMFGWLTTGESLSSSPFVIVHGDRVEVEWRLEIFPKGFDEKHKHHVSIYLRCVSCTPGPINVQFWICLLDDAGDISYGKKTKCVTFTANSKKGFDDFANGSAVLKYKDEEDVVIILCEGEIQK